MPENPLIQMLDAGRLPPFSEIKPKHALPALEQVLAQGRQTVAACTQPIDHRTWDNLVGPLESADDRIERLWNPISHLNAVMNSAGWRKAYKAGIEKLTDYHSEVGQNTALFQSFQALAEGDEWPKLDHVEQKVVKDALRDFRLAGVDLPDEKKARFRQIQTRLANLQTRFEENLLDAAKAWTKHIVDKAELAGLPDTALARAEQEAKAQDLDGWLLTLDHPSYHAVITYAQDRELRKEMYTAWTTRASDRGPNAGEFDNSELMDEILALRHEEAGLLGYANYAERALATRMANSTDEVLGFLRDLAKRSRPQAKAELKELREFAASKGLDEFEAWDLAFYAERLRQERFQLSDEDLRPYFPVPQVIEGMFEVVGRLYGLDIVPTDDLEVWHKDVTTYEIRDAEGAVRGRFYLDLYTRRDKRGGAWMADCISRRKTAAGLQLPAAFLSCNFTPPVGGKPSLLTHNEVTTLFHEFGHGLHHMLTRIDHLTVAGINGVPWDAVELPSQFMENWCWEREALNLFARHHETGGALPVELYERMKASRNYNAGLAMLRQLEFSLFDFLLHRDYDPKVGARVQETLDAVRKEVAVVAPPEFNRFAHGFAHIFADSYAAGYYSYKWAEVLSADAYSAFEEAGVFDAATGRRFCSTILEQGGSREAAELFRDFRGREPSIEPLLRHTGITDSAA